MSTDTPTPTQQPPAGNRVQILFARDAQGLHSPVISITDGLEHKAAKLDPTLAEKIGMQLLELAVECRKANAPANQPPPPLAG